MARVIFAPHQNIIHHSKNQSGRIDLLPADECKVLFQGHTNSKIRNNLPNHWGRKWVWEVFVVAPLCNGWRLEMPHTVNNQFELFDNRFVSLKKSKHNLFIIDGWKKIGYCLYYVLPNLFNIHLINLSIFVINNDPSNVVYRKIMVPVKISFIYY